MFPQIESEMSDLQKEIEKGLVHAKPRGIWASYASMEIFFVVDQARKMKL